MKSKDLIKQVINVGIFRSSPSFLRPPAKEKSLPPTLKTKRHNSFEHNSHNWINFHHQADSTPLMHPPSETPGDDRTTATRMNVKPSILPEWLSLHPAIALIIPIITFELYTLGVFLWKLSRNIFLLRLSPSASSAFPFDSILARHSPSPPNLFYLFRSICRSFSSLLLSLAMPRFIRQQFSRLSIAFI